MKIDKQTDIVTIIHNNIILNKIYKNYKVSNGKSFL